MRTKTDTFHRTTLSADYDVIALTETWLNDDIGNAELSSEYTIFRCDRNNLTSTLKRGGGVLIAVRNNLKASQVQLTNCESLEQVCVRVQLNSLAIYICCIYLRPNSNPCLYSNHASSIQEMLESSDSSDSIVVVGDYNLPHLQWQLDTDLNSYIPLNASSEQEISLCETVLPCGLHQICSAYNANGRLLDLAFVNDPVNVELLEPPTPILKVDIHHKPFIIRLDYLPAKQIVHRANRGLPDFDFRHCDFDDLSTSLERVNWSGILQTDNLDDAVTNFYDTVFSILNEKVPFKRNLRHSKTSPPWWTAEIRHSRNVLRKARKRYFKQRTHIAKMNLQQLESSYQSSVDSAFKDYLNRTETDLQANPSSFWSYVNSKKRNKSIPSDVTYNNIRSNSTDEAANLFADFFKDVYETNDVSATGPYIDSIPSYNMSLAQPALSEVNIHAALSSVDPSKGPGADRLPPVFVRSCAAPLAVPMTIIFNRSLTSGKFPTAWKTAAIIPIHKSGNVHNVENYRAISLLPCLAKVFERLIYDVMFPVALPIISECQHGFVKNRSTLTNLMDYSNFLFPCMDKRVQVDSIYVDFAKAFDKVPHNLAIAKLQHYGFPAWLTNWLKDYLTNRTAFVSFGNASSIGFHIPSGVPQGSHLGPLIFVLFINDLCLRLRSGKLFYADDLKIFRSISSLLDCVALQHDIDILSEWCNNNGMHVNVKKCKVISFSRVQSPISFDYALNGSPLEQVEWIKDLGVIFDKKLTFAKHISTTIAKAFATLGFIKRNTQEFNNIYTLKTLYCTLVRSILEYAVQVWSPYHATHSERIERVQRSFLRYALRKLPWNDPLRLPPYEDRCKLINLQPLTSRRVMLQRLLIYDILSGKTDCSSLLADINIHAPCRRLRNRGFIALPFRRTLYGQNNPFSRCCQHFNEVFDVYDFGMSRNTFKIAIKDL